jgi:molybdopterin synthase catalytic subunit
MPGEFMKVSNQPIHPDQLRDDLVDAAAGAYTSFEGWIRNVNDGHDVLRLEYEAYEPLAISEGQRVIEEAMDRFRVLNARCVHRVGLLEIGECAVWVGVSSGHRDEAFVACRYIIDEVKVRLPIWKKEHYADGNSGWVNCERCATHGHRHAELKT